jgi:hypothetical protein
MSETNALLAQIAEGMKVLAEGQVELRKELDEAKAGLATAKAPTAKKEKAPKTQAKVIVARVVDEDAIEQFGDVVITKKVGSTITRTFYVRYGEQYDALVAGLEAAKPRD